MKLTEGLEREEKLAAVVAEIQDKLNRGEALRREEYLQRFPEFKMDLAGYFSCGSFLETALGSNTVGPQGQPHGGDFDSIDLQEFPIEGQLDDESLGPVFRLSAGPGQEARELVVLRSRPQSGVAQRLEETVNFLRKRRTRGLPGPLSFDRLEKTPFIIREHGEGRDLRRLLKKLIAAKGAVGIGAVAVSIEPGGDEGRKDGLERQARRDLANRLASNRGHLDALYKLFEEWALVMDRAHQLGVVHGSLSPRCFAIDCEARPFVRGVGAGPLATGGGAIDTPPSDRRWLAPEVADPSRGPTTWKSDIYGLGLALAGSLSLDLPYWEYSPSEVLERLREEPSQLLQELPLALDPTVRTLLASSLSWDLYQRPHSAAEMAAVLRRARHTRVIVGLRTPRYLAIALLFTIALGLVVALLFLV
ncbi:MAG: hypothetical protein V3W41_20190 [Planctomycetota bacterium]